MWQWKEQRGSSFLESIRKPKNLTANPLKAVRILPLASSDLGSSQGPTAEWLTSEVCCPQHRQQEDAALTEGWGPCWGESFALFKKQQARQILFTLLSAQHSWDQNKSMINSVLCLETRGILNMQASRMKLFPTKSISLPRVHGDHVHFYWVTTTLVPISLK